MREVRVEGTWVGDLGLVSPDVVDRTGRAALDSPVWNPGGACATSLGDAVSHTTPMAAGVYEWCSDLNCDGAVTLADAAIVTPSLAASVECSGDAGP